MQPLCECVPNFSEGRRPEIVEQIVDEIRNTPGANLLGSEMDADHNRSVVTFAGTPEACCEAAFRAARKAAELIDLNNHEGEHPRMGALDVCPLVPIRNCTLDDLAPYAEKLGERIGRELHIPVFLYEHAAKRPERKNLANIRKGQFEGLRELIGKDPARTPDFGPNHIHPTAGAMAVGARFFLVAYNVNLETTDLGIAQRIGKAIRESSGGFPCVKGMGFDLPDKKCVQVSMNLTNYTVTSPVKVYQEIERLARQEGVEIRESELIGLIPQDAVNRSWVESLKIAEFDELQIIESKLATIPPDPIDALAPFSNAVAAKDPVPGGGSVSAHAGELAASLAQMVSNLTIGSKKWDASCPRLKEAQEALARVRGQLNGMIRKDQEAYAAFAACLKLPKDTDEQKADRKEAMQNALVGAARAPFETLWLCGELADIVAVAAEEGNPNAASDAGVAAHLVRAAAHGAALNIRINLGGITDEVTKAELALGMSGLLKRVEEGVTAALATVDDRLGG